MLFIAAICSLAASIFTYALEINAITGPTLIGFFVLLALACRGTESTRRYAYALWIFAAVTTAMFFPNRVLTVGSFQSSHLILPLLQIIMFGMGSQLSIHDFAGVVKMPKGILVGIISQFTIMPLVGLFLASTFGFPPEIAAGIILVGSSPSGLASNVMAFLARANVALSVTLTTVTTSLSPFFTPALMRLLGGQYINVDFWSMMLGIINIVILPIIAGLIFNMFSYGGHTRRSVIFQVAAFATIVLLKSLLGHETQGHDLHNSLISLAQDFGWFMVLPVGGALIFKKAAGGSKEWLDNAMSLVSMLGIGIVITIITASGRDSLMTIGLLLILACIIHNVTGYALGYWVCRLLGMPERDARTVSFEVGMQNAGLASGLALQMGKVATVGLAAAVFGPMMNITGSSLASWFRDRTPKDELNT